MVGCLHDLVYSQGSVEYDDSERVTGADPSKHGFVFHPHTDTVDEHLDGNLRVRMKTEGEKIDARGVAVQLLSDSSRLVKAVTKRRECSRIEDGGELGEVFMREFHDVNSATHSPKISC